jgi:hypothetical protein
MNDSINFPLVFVSNHYSCLLEDLLKMPEITGHRGSPLKQMMLQELDFLTKQASALE